MELDRGSTNERLREVHMGITEVRHRACIIECEGSTGRELGILGGVAVRNRGSRPTTARVSAITSNRGRPLESKHLELHRERFGSVEENTVYWE